MPEELGGALNLTNVSGGGISVDFSETQDFEPLPPGIYPIEFIEVKAGTSAKGEQMLKCKIKATDEETGKTSNIFHNFMLQGRGAGFFKAFVTIFKDENWAINVLSNGQIIPEDLVGFECKAKISIKEYNGKTSNQIDGAGFIKYEPESGLI